MNAPGGIRTRDHPLVREALCPLSYGRAAAGAAKVQYEAVGDQPVGTAPAVARARR